MMVKTFSIIVAVARNGVIGKDNDLIWHISDDLKRFKRLTSGHTIIMGRKTFESLPKGALPNRRNVVLGHDPDYKAENIELVTSVEQAIEIADVEKENFIIGGASLYRAFLPWASKIYLTEVHKEFDGDVSFPEFDRNEWKEVFREDHWDVELPFSFVDMVRI